MGLGNGGELVGLYNPKKLSNTPPQIDRRRDEEIQVL